MTISFFDHGDVPQPREKVRLLKFMAQVLPDRARVKVAIHVTPFLERPSLGVVLLNADSPDSELVADMTIIETMHDKMEFTLHVRGDQDPAGNYRLLTRLYYDQNVHQPYDEAVLTLEIPTDMPDEDLIFESDLNPTDAD